MMINTEELISMAEAGRDFDRVARLVDQEGIAIISRGDKPCYIVMDFGKYEEIKSLRDKRRKQIEGLADQLISDNIEAFRELAK